MKLGIHRVSPRLKASRIFSNFSNVKAWAWPVPLALIVVPILFLLVGISLPGIISANNTPATAILWYLGEPYKNWIDYQGDIDWYKFDVPASGQLTLQLTVPAALDYDVQLHNVNAPNGQIGISQLPQGQVEQINMSVTAGTYYVKIYGAGNNWSASQPYTLLVNYTTTAQGQYRVKLTNGDDDAYANINVKINLESAFTMAVGGQNSTIYSNYFNTTPGWRYVFIWWTDPDIGLENVLQQPLYIPASGQVTFDFTIPRGSSFASQFFNIAYFETGSDAVPMSPQSTYLNKTVPTYVVNIAQGLDSAQQWYQSNLPASGYTMPSGGFPFQANLVESGLAPLSSGLPTVTIVDRYSFTLVPGAITDVKVGQYSSLTNTVWFDNDDINPDTFKTGMLAAGAIPGVDFTEQFTSATFAANVATHELFHFYQDINGLVGSSVPSWRVEGTARWIEDPVMKTHIVMEPYLVETSLTNQSYNTWQFWHYLSVYQPDALKKTLNTIRELKFNDLPTVVKAQTTVELKSIFADFIKDLLQAKQIGNTEVGLVTLRGKFDDNLMSTEQRKLATTQLSTNPKTVNLTISPLSAKAIRITSQNTVPEAVGLSWSASNPDVRVLAKMVTSSGSNVSDLGAMVSATKYFSVSASQELWLVFVNPLDATSLSFTANVFIDTTPPTTPSNLSKTTQDNNNKPVFVWTASADATSGIDYYETKLDTGTWANIGNVTSYTWPSIVADGNHTVNLRAVDKAGNNGTAASVSFTIDATPPTTPTNLSKTTPDSNNKPTFTWTASTDATSGIDYYEAKMDTGTWANLGNVTSYTWPSGVSNGNHNIEIRAVDKAGNIGSIASFTFSIIINSLEATTGDILIQVGSSPNQVGVTANYLATATFVPTIVANVGDTITIKSTRGYAIAADSLALASATISNGTGVATLSVNVLPQQLPTASTNTLTVTTAGTFLISLPVGATGTVISGTAIITGSPQALVDGTNIITASTTGTFTITLTMVSTAGSGIRTVRTQTTYPSVTLTDTVAAGTGQGDFAPGAVLSATINGVAITSIPASPTIGIMTGLNITDAGRGRFLISLKIPVLKHNTDIAPHIIKISDGTTERTANLIINPRARFTPDRTAKGKTITVTGDGFHAASTVDIEVRDAITPFTGGTVSLNVSQGLVNTDANGAFSSTFKAPEVMIKAKNINIKDSAGAKTNAVELTKENRDFTIDPSIIITPNSGTPSSNSTLDGSEFPVNSTITTFNIGGVSALASLSNTTINMDGKISAASFIVPAGLTTGIKSVIVTAVVAATGQTASGVTSFAVTQPPVAVISSPQNGNSYFVTDNISFNGSQSSDPDGDTLAYEWSSSKDGTLGTTATLTKQLTIGSHTISLKVSDGKEGLNTASVNVTVKTQKALDVTWGDHSTPTTIKPGQMAGVPVTLTNTGTQTWPNGGVNPVYVTYHWYNASWQPVEWGTGLRSTFASDVAGGQTVSITASLKAPSTPGTYNLFWDVVQEGVAWFSGQGAQLLTVSNITVSTSQQRDVQWVSHSTPTTIKPGEIIGVPITLTDTGSQTWLKNGANPVYVTYHWYNASWQPVEWGIGLRSAFSQDVATGQMVSLTASLKAPSTAGNYNLIWDVIQEGVAWFSGQGAPILGVSSINVVASQVKDVQWISQNTPTTIKPGEIVGVPITLTNTGSQTWAKDGANPVYVTYHWYNASWQPVEWGIGLRSAFSQDVATGQMVNLTASLKAPPTAGTYNLIWDVVHESVAWFSGQGAPLAVAPGITVAATQAKDVQWVSHNTPGSLAANQQVNVTITLTNTGSQVWPQGGANPVKISYHWLTSSGQIAVWDGLMTSFTVDVSTGQMVTLSANLRAPSGTGSYYLAWDLVHDGIGWFSSQGAPLLYTSNITVQ